MHMFYEQKKVVDDKFTANFLYPIILTNFVPCRTISLNNIIIIHILLKQGIKIPTKKTKLLNILQNVK